LNLRRVAPPPTADQKKSSSKADSKESQISDEERLIRKNAAQALLAELQTVSKQFRQMQKTYTDRLEDLRDDVPEVDRESVSLLLFALALSHCCCVVEL